MNTRLLVLGAAVVIGLSACGRSVDGGLEAGSADVPPAVSPSPAAPTVAAVSEDEALTSICTTTREIRSAAVPLLSPKVLAANEGRALDDETVLDRPLEDLRAALARGSQRMATIRGRVPSTLGPFFTELDQQVQRFSELTTASSGLSRTEQAARMHGFHAQYFMLDRYPGAEEMEQKVGTPACPTP